MAEVGHADPAVTLGIYAHVMRRGPEARQALRVLVEGRVQPEHPATTALEGTLTRNTPGVANV